MMMEKTLKLKPKKRVITQPKEGKPEPKEATTPEPIPEPELKTKSKAKPKAKVKPQEEPIPEPAPTVTPEPEPIPEPAPLTVEASQESETVDSEATPNRWDKQRKSTRQRKTPTEWEAAQRHKAQKRWLISYLNTLPTILEYKPLMLGAYKAIQEAVEGQASGKAIRELLGLHVARIPYIKAVLAGGARYHPISGEPIGEVTTAQQAHEQLKLNWLESRHEANLMDVYVKDLLEKLGKATIKLGVLREKERQQRETYYSKKHAIYNSETMPEIEATISSESLTGS